MKRLGLILLFLVVGSSAFAQAAAEPKPAAPLPRGIRILFSPEDNIEDAIIRLINGATTQILFNQNAVTNTRIAHAIVTAFTERKVYVAGVLERNPAVKNYRSPEYFATNRIPIFLAAVPNKGENNNRYLVIDGQIVVTGSYNWTQSSQLRNNENVIIISEPSIAETYLTHFRAAMESGERVEGVAKPPQQPQQP